MCWCGGGVTNHESLKSSLTSPLGPGSNQAADFPVSRLFDSTRVPLPSSSPLPPPAFLFQMLEIKLNFSVPPLASLQQTPV